MRELADAVAREDNQPTRTFAAMERIVRDAIGFRLFTVMEIVAERGVAVRSYSNMPEAYPVSGEKPIPENRWSDIVLAKHRTFVANRIEEIEAVFPDHALIRSLGCESCLNLPVVIAGRVRGTLNCLHVADHYTPGLVLTAENLKPAAALAILLADHIRENGAAGP